MSVVSPESVKKLRQHTGAGILDCKHALSSCENNFDKAIDWLRKKDLSRVAKKSSRQAAEGSVSSYVHAGGRIGVLVEVNSETDFVARNKQFQDFVKDLALHITAMNPTFVKEQDITKEHKEKEMAVFTEQAKKKAKNEEMLSRISQGLYKKWLAEVCLLNQDFVRQNQEKKQTVLDSLTQLISTIGENIVIRRFVRYELGETTEKKQVDFAQEVAQVVKR